MYVHKNKIKINPSIPFDSKIIDDILKDNYNVLMRRSDRREMRRSDRREMQRSDRREMRRSDR